MATSAEFEMFRYNTNEDCNSRVEWQSARVLVLALTGSATVKIVPMMKKLSLKAPKQLVRGSLGLHTFLISTFDQRTSQHLMV